MERLDCNEIEALIEKTVGIEQFISYLGTHNVLSCIDNDEIIEHIKYCEEFDEVVNDRACRIIKAREREKEISKEEEESNYNDTSDYYWAILSKMLDVQPTNCKEMHLKIGQLLDKLNGSIYNKKDKLNFKEYA